MGLLGQILQSDVEAEVAAVNEALVAALEKDVKATMSGLLEHMGADASSRARAVSFIERALLPRASALLNESEETQALVADHLKKVRRRHGINVKKVSSREGRKAAMQCFRFKPLACPVAGRLFAGQMTIAVSLSSNEHA